jgi:hypothetical protein
MRDETGHGRAAARIRAARSAVNSADEGLPDPRRGGGITATSSIGEACDRASIRA